MSRDALDIAVVGASGAAGEQFLAALAVSDLPIGTLLPYASSRRSPSVDTIDFRGRSRGIEPASRIDDARPDVAVLCVPSRAAAELSARLMARGVFVVDAGNAAAGVLNAPLVLPGAQAELPQGVVEAGAVRTPSAAGWFLAQLLAPLREIGLKSCTGVVSLSASARGRAAMEELGQQVVATLTQQDPHRRVFGEGLAFDTLPEDVPPDEWSTAERLAADEAAMFAGLDPSAVGVQLCVQPLFSGMSGGLHLRGVDADAVEAAWRAASDVHAVSRAARLRPRAVTGKPGVWWGRLVADPAGDGVFCWAVADNLFGAGGDSPVRAIRWLHAAGLLGEV